MSTVGNRIKRYEEVSSQKLLPRSPLFIRVDGRAFHTFTKGCNKPFDMNIIAAMTYAARQTAQEMSGFKLAYIQSDEATFMLTDYDTFETQGWFNYELNKVVSISASAFTAYFNAYYGVTGKPAMFDSRAFTVPVDDAPNAFLWRQQDWRRNSIQMLARSAFNQKECNGKNLDELLTMCSAKGLEWHNLKPQLKYGTFVEADYELSHDLENYDLLRERIC